MVRPRSQNSNLKGRLQRGHGIERQRHRAGRGDEKVDLGERDLMEARRKKRPHGSMKKKGELIKRLNEKEAHERIQERRSPVLRENQGETQDGEN